jgi:uncharacterized BrkB/YihY/UPF0761 family membrane protein
MKQAAVRFLVYVALLGIVFAVFGAPASRPQLGRGAEHGLFTFLLSSARAIGLYLGYYGVAIGFWLIVFELIFRVVRRERRRRERAIAGEG